ncbi:hypothetical protein QBC38DRAFT_172443 [Podospora fimiseda]|uniref:Uncharacterized protein n=1 Tax=Podospora fimiseda TaxID=252190 RepID=A0AAN7BQY7_9PEZI|nr:hypothetical protein QBC38DRAFT_172443 [Podospora fimiseda]
MLILLQYSPEFRPTSHKPSRPSIRRARRSSFPGSYPLLSPRPQHTIFTRSESLSPTMSSSSTEASRAEIVLLAAGIFLLVLQLLFLLWVAVRRRRLSTSFLAASSIANSKNNHSRPSSPCLWKEAFSDALPHEPLLLGPDRTSSDVAIHHNGSFLQRVRKASEDIAGAVQYELMELGRKVSAHGRAVRAASSRRASERMIIRDEEFGLDGWSGNPHDFRRHSSCVVGPSSSGEVRARARTQRRNSSAGECVV